MGAGRAVRTGWPWRLRVTVGVLGLASVAAGAAPLLFHRGRFDPGGLLFGLVLLAATVPAVAVYVAAVRGPVMSVLVGIALLAAVAGPTTFMAAEVLAGRGGFGVGLIAFGSPVLGLVVAGAGALTDLLIRTLCPRPGGEVAATGRPD